VSIASQQRLKDLEALVAQLRAAVADQELRLSKIEQARKPGPKPKDKR
jgi:hypothetical protein